jgi:hypothetical protein
LSEFSIFIKLNAYGGIPYYKCSRDDIYIHQNILSDPPNDAFGFTYLVSRINNIYHDLNSPSYALTDSVYSKSDMNTQLNSYITDTKLNTTLSNYYTKNDTDSLLQ